MWKVVLCLYAATWSLGEKQKPRDIFQTTVHDMTKEVMAELKEILDTDVRAMLPGTNIIYKTECHFNMRGMGRLYNVTDPFIDVVARWQAYPDGVVTSSPGHIYITPLKKSWRLWLSHYLGPTGIVGVAILVAIILPLVGLFWCCWYWCRVGCRRRPFDRDYDSWNRTMLAILFIGLLMLFWLGVVCAFSSEAHVNKHVYEVTTTYRTAVYDVVQFLNATQEQAIYLLEHSFSEIKERLMELLKDVLPTTLRVLHDASNLRSLTTLNRFVYHLDDIRDDLATMQNLTNALRVRAIDLNSGLRKVKNQLLRTLSTCDQAKCVALHNKYDLLDTEIQYSQMPDVSGLLQNVSRLASSGLKEGMVESTKVLRTLQRTLQDSVDVQAPAMRASIDGIGDKLKDMSKQIRLAVFNVIVRMYMHLKYIDTVDEKIAEYAAYRQYLSVAAALCLLLMAMLLTWGLLVGMCGGRPEVYGAHDCCSKAGGARSLLCGVALVLMLGGFVAVVFALNFAFGVLATRFVCDPLTYPLGNRLFLDLDQMVDLERMLFGEKKTNFPSLTSVLVQCHRNFTVYAMLRLRRVLDLENLPAVISPENLAAGLLEAAGASLPTFTLPIALPSDLTLPPGITVPTGITLPEGLTLPGGITVPPNFSLPPGVQIPENLPGIQNIPGGLPPGGLPGGFNFGKRWALDNLKDSIYPDYLSYQPNKKRKRLAELGHAESGLAEPGLDELGLPDFDFNRILDALETNLTSLALDGLARQLNSTAAGLARPQWADEARELQRAAHDLAVLNRRVLVPMRRDAAMLNETTRRVSEMMVMRPGMDMNTAMTLLGDQSHLATSFLAENSEQLMAMVMQKFSTMIADKLTEYIRHATFYVRYEVGRGGPLSLIFNATRDSFCIKVLRPMNGYWMALGWCILLFVPLMVTACRLAEMYMQLDPYPGPRAESFYSSDSIPPTRWCRASCSSNPPRYS